MAGKKDFTQIAHAVFQQAVGEAEKPPEPTAKQRAGHKGGVKGGTSRMGALTPEARAALAKKAAEARWKK